MAASRWTPLGITPDNDNTSTIGDGVEVPTRYRAAYEVRPVGVVEFVVETDGGRSRVSELRVTERERLSGVTGVSLSKVPLSELVENANRVAAIMWSRPDTKLGPAMEKASGASRRRSRVTASRLAEILATYEAEGIEAVAKVENIGERHAWRLLQQAREQADASSS